MVAPAWWRRGCPAAPSHLDWGPFWSSIRTWLPVSLSGRPGRATSGIASHLRLARGNRVVQRRQVERHLVRSENVALVHGRRRAPLQPLPAAVDEMAEEAVVGYPDPHFDPQLPSPTRPFHREVVHQVGRRHVSSSSREVVQSRSKSLPGSALKTELLESGSGKPRVSKMKSRKKEEDEGEGLARPLGT